MNDAIKILNTKKAFPDGDTPVKLFNQSLVNCEFPHCLEQGEVIPVSKKEGKRDKSSPRKSNLQNL